jgi:hypothetical protein
VVFSHAFDLDAAAVLIANTQPGHPRLQHLAPDVFMNGFSLSRGSVCVSQA